MSDHADSISEFKHIQIRIIEVSIEHKDGGLDKQWNCKLHFLI